MCDAVVFGEYLIGDNIKLPVKFSEIVSAVLFKGHAVDEGGSATYEIRAHNVVLEKVDDETVMTTVHIAKEDFLVIKLIKRGAYV